MNANSCLPLPAGVLLLAAFACTVHPSFCAQAAPPIPPAAAPAQHTVVIPEQTRVEIELKKTLTSQEAKEGDRIEFAVVQAVRIGEVTVIAPGAIARARVTRAARSGRWGKQGKLVMEMEDVEAVSGARVPLRFAEFRRAGEKADKAAQGIVTGMYLTYYFPLAPLALAAKGKSKGNPVQWAAGERFEVYVRSQTEIPLPATNQQDNAKPPSR